MKPLCVSNIPGELKDRRQWVGWKYETRDGKLTKIPKDPKTGHEAKTNNPDTWASIQEALIATETYKLDGIGFVFSESDPYTGVDLDSCLNPDTGELQAWARRYIDLFQSYTEITPSGKGLHIIVKGKLPGKGRKKRNFEVYDKGRFFTFTGCLFDANGNDTMQAG
jgi:primase-polymerase (primpol)-like protein